MGMYGWLRSLKEAAIEQLVADPSLYDRVFGNGSAEQVGGASGDLEIPGLGSVQISVPGRSEIPDFAKDLFKGGTLTNVQSHDPSPPPPPFDGSETCDLDQAWDVLGWTLSGGRKPDSVFNFIYGEGGRPVFPEEAEMPIHAFVNADVARIADAFVDVHEDVLRTRFDPEKMAAADVYPGVWDEDVEEIDLFVERFRELRRFVYRTADKGLGMVGAIE